MTLVFQARILQRRSEESAFTAQMGRLLAVTNVAASNGVDIISLSVLCVYVFAMGRELTPAVVFTYWVLLGLLHGRIFYFPVALKHVKEGLGALRRLDSFLLSQRTESSLSRIAGANVDITSSSLSKTGAMSTPGASIVLHDASFSWERIDLSDNDAERGVKSSKAIPQPRAVLRDLNLSCESGSLTAIIGAVGTGKSTLLLSLLGETRLCAGRVNTPFFLSDNRIDGMSSVEAIASRSVPNESVAYVPQIAWILRGSSIRENILLGQPYDESRYEEVLRVTALIRDIARLPQGDATLVSSCTLSGGQKQRISIARAAYTRARIVLLDDCFSALDGQVGSYVFEVSNTADFFAVVHVKL